VHIAVWVVSIAFFVLVLWIMVRREAVSARRDESAVDPMFNRRRTALSEIGPGQSLSLRRCSNEDVSRVSE